MGSGGSCKATPPALPGMLGSPPPSPRLRTAVGVAEEEEGGRICCCCCCEEEEERGEVSTPSWLVLTEAGRVRPGRGRGRK